jgi:hypothetical protein
VSGDEPVNVLAVKKIKNEIGLDVTIVETLGENEYIANKPEQGKVLKHVTYYLASSDFTPLVLEQKGGLDNARWFTVDELTSLKMYDDIRPMITKALTIIKEKKNN